MKEIKLSMLFLALYPILNIYTFFVPGVSWGTVAIGWLIGVELYKKRGKVSFEYPRGYSLYWIYLTISYIFLSSFKLASFVPGGVSFFLYSVVLGYAIAHFNYFYFKRYYWFVFFVSAIILCFQEIQYLFMGYRFHVLFVYGSLLDGTSLPELISEHVFGSRSSSFFREPAHFAQYILPLLAMELFDHKSVKKILTYRSLFIIVILLLLRSGNGIVGLLLLLFVKILHYLYCSEIKNKIFKLIILAGIISLPLVYYARTEAAQHLLFRSNELQYDENGASFARIYRGYALFEELPLLNKTFGISEDNLVSIIPKTKVSFMFSGERQSDVYCNCVQFILIYTGIIGLCFVFSIYYHIYKCSTVLGKSLIAVLVLLSFIASIYNSYIMLFTTCVAMYDQKTKII